jgi:outer membrane protein TolC
MRLQNALTRSARSCGRQPGPAKPAPGPLVSTRRGARAWRAAHWFAILSCVALVPLVAPAATPVRLDLPALVARARKQPKVEATRQTAAAAHARARAVARTWTPTIEVTAIGGPSPEVRCSPSPEMCITTSPSEAGIQFSGLAGRIDARLQMILFTFGKLDAGNQAAGAGARAQDALAAVAEADAVVDAAKAYYAVKLGRELRFMLDEGRGYVQDELDREDKLLAKGGKGAGEITETDRLRLRALRAEIDVRLSEAQKVEETGLAGVHYIVGDDATDVDEEPLAAVVFQLPAMKDSRRSAQANRPERAAADAGAAAADGLLRLEQNRWWPDLVLIGQGSLARAQGADDPQNAFANDPLNTTSGGLGVVLKWNLDPFARPFHVDQAEAEARAARATAVQARDGVGADAERAWADARDARDRLKASREGEKAAKAWLVSVLQSEAAGLLEPKDLGDALISYFTMRGRVIQAIFDWNVAVVALERASGQGFSAPHYEEE